MPEQTFILNVGKALLRVEYIDPEKPIGCSFSLM
jgi:hypothetical protein